jgi:hypothetical protein
MKNHLKKLIEAQSKYESAIGNAESDFQDKIDFDYSFQWQPSDGWTIVDGKSNVAPLDSALNIIKQKGKLSHEDFKGICI